MDLEGDGRYLLEGRRRDEEVYEGTGCVACDIGLNHTEPWHFAAHLGSRHPGACECDACNETFGKRRKGLR